MSETIIGLVDWLQTPPGRYLMEWERTRLDAAVADIFGYHALQLGLPQLDSLVANRMPHQWLALDQAGARWWPILGAAYFVVAVKRVRGMRMLGPAWKAKPARAVGSVTVAHTLPHGSERERSN